MALKRYKLIALDMQGDVITTSDVDTVAEARKSARTWLRYSNVGSVRVWRNGRHVDLVEVYVNNAGKYSVIRNGIVKSIRV